MSPGPGTEGREPTALGPLLGHGLVVLLVPVCGLLGLAVSGDGPLLAVVAQVRVGLAQGAPPGGLDGLPPFVGEPGATVGAHGTAGLSLGPLLCGDAAQLLLVLPLAGGVLSSLAGAGRFAARVADRLEERLVLWSAEAPEDAPAGPYSFRCFMPVTAMGSLPSYMWKPSSYASPFQCRWVSSASYAMTVLGLRGPIRLKTSSSGGCS